MDGSMIWRRLVVVVAVVVAVAVAVAVVGVIVGVIVGVSAMPLPQSMLMLWCPITCLSLFPSSLASPSPSLGLSVGSSRHPGLDHTQPTTIHSTQYTHNHTPAYHSFTNHLIDTTCAKLPQSGQQALTANTTSPHYHPRPTSHQQWVSATSTHYATRPRCLFVPSWEKTACWGRRA